MSEGEIWWAARSWPPGTTVHRGGPRGGHRRGQAHHRCRAQRFAENTLEYVLEEPTRTLSFGNAAPVEVEPALGNSAEARWSGPAPRSRSQACRARGRDTADTRRPRRRPQPAVHEVDARGPGAGDPSASRREARSPRGLRRRWSRDRSPPIPPRAGLDADGGFVALDHPRNTAPLLRLAPVRAQSAPTTPRLPSTTIRAVTPQTRAISSTTSSVSKDPHPPAPPYSRGMVVPTNRAATRSLRCCPRDTPHWRPTEPPAPGTPHPPAPSPSPSTPPAPDLQSCESMTPALLTAPEPHAGFMLGSRARSSCSRPRPGTRSLSGYGTSAPNSSRPRATGRL